MTEAQKKMVLELLWDSLRRDAHHTDRVHTGWGTKTQDGLIACIQNIINMEKEVGK